MYEEPEEVVPEELPTEEVEEPEPVAPPKGTVQAAGPPANLLPLVLPFLAWRAFCLVALHEF